MPSPGAKCGDMYLQVYNSIKKEIYTDQTSCFLITWSHNKYQMVSVELDCNYIDVKPLKSKSMLDFIKAYQASLSWWSATRWVSPNWHILGPEEFKAFIQSNGCKVEFVPPDIKRQNINMAYKLTKTMSFWSSWELMTASHCIIGICLHLKLCQL